MLIRQQSVTSRLSPVRTSSLPATWQRAKCSPSSTTSPLSRRGQRCCRQDGCNIAAPHGRRWGSPRGSMLVALAMPIPHDTLAANGINDVDIEAFLL